jgi:hypothetical protein
MIACLMSACVHTDDRYIRTIPTQEAQEFSNLKLSDVEKNPDPATLDRSPYEHVKFGTEEGDSFDLYAVEQDDRGVLFQRDQVDVIRERIKKRADGNGAIIIVYVHGWKHNATPCDDNMSCFRTILQKVAQTEKAASANSNPPYPRRVVSGIYVGWRGLATCHKIPKQLSFFSRKRVAERIGTAQTRVLLQNLRDLRNELDDPDNKLQNPKGGTRTRLVIVGHSLGAGLIQAAAITELQQDLYSAKAQVEGEPNGNGKPKPDDRLRLKGFGDLVVLVNPAFEAQLYDAFPKEVRKLRDDKKLLFPNDRPVLIIVSSTGDFPTHYLFPVVRFFGLLLQPFKLARGPKYWFRYIVTAGNYVGYRTHVASLKKSEETKETKEAKSEAVSKKEREDSPCFRPSHNQGLGSYPSGCTCSQNTGDFNINPTLTEHMMEPGRKIELSKVILTPTGRFNRDPYWVITANRDVVKDHGDIFNPTLTSMIRELVVGALRPDPPKPK